MATYTIELGKLLTLDGFDIGMKDYPVTSFLDNVGDMEQWREALNQKIINHYYFNEICCLPPDRFKWFLNSTLNEQMPYFNMLYNALNEKWQFYTGGTLTEIVKADGTSKDNGSKTGTDGRTLTNSETRTKTGTDSTAGSGSDELARSGIDTTGNTASNSNTHSDYTLNVASDTPGQMLNIESDIANNTYASTAGKTKNNGTTTASSNSTDTTTYNSKETTTRGTTNTTTYDTAEKTSIDTNDTTTYNTATTSDRQHNDNRNRTVSGLNNKSYAELFKEYSESIRNLDLEVIESLKDCFMGIL